MRKWMYTRQGGWKLDEFNIHHLAVSYRWHLTTANDRVRRLHGHMTTFVAITGK